MRDDQQRIATAYELYARQPRRASMKVASAARAVGASRTLFYSHWETATDLGESVAIRRATAADGWQQQVIESDLGLFKAIQHAVQSPDAASGATTRAVLAAEPVGCVGHDGLRAWEARWLTWLAARLEHTVGPHPDVPWTVAAAMVTALVDGTLLLRGPRLTGTVGPHDASFAATVADAAAATASYFADHIRGPNLPVEGPTCRRSKPLPSAMRLLDRVVAAIDAGELPAGHSDDMRVVSPKALALELGVTTRWIFGCWPSAADFNADIFGESLQRIDAMTDLTALTAFSEAAISSPTEAGPVLVRINELLLDLDHLEVPLVLLSLLDLVEHEDVGGRHHDLIRRWFDGLQMRAAALLQATDRRLAPHLTISDYVDVGIGAGLGSWRIGAAHPDLLDQRCRYLGDGFATMAAGLDAMTQACVDQHRSHAEPPPGQRPTSGA